MKELETKLKDIKKALRPFDIIGAVCIIICLVGAALLLTDIIGKFKNDGLFFSGISLIAAMLVISITNLLVAKDLYNYYHELKRQIRKLKNK